MSDPQDEPELEAALSSFMAEEHIDRDEALRRILRDWLIEHGYLKPGADTAGGHDGFGI